MRIAACSIWNYFPVKWTGTFELLGACVILCCQTSLNVLMCCHETTKGLFWDAHLLSRHAGIRSTKGYKNQRVNDLVIIYTDFVARNCWPLGRVCNAFSGRDGKVRCVEVKTKKGQFKRPLHKLAWSLLLPIVTLPDSDLQIYIQLLDVTTGLLRRILNIYDNYQIWLCLPKFTLSNMTVPHRFYSLFTINILCA